MKLTPQRKSVIRNRRTDGITKAMMMPTRTKKMINGFDDFLSQLAAMKERNNLIIGGIRIC
jgi:hypothetical protein